MSAVGCDRDLHPVRSPILFILECVCLRTAYQLSHQLVRFAVRSYLPPCRKKGVRRASDAAMTRASNGRSGRQVSAAKDFSRKSRSVVPGLYRSASASRTRRELARASKWSGVPVMARWFVVEADCACHSLLECSVRWRPSFPGVPTGSGRVFTPAFGAQKGDIARYCGRPRLCGSVVGGETCANSAAASQTLPGWPASKTLSLSTGP